MKVVIIGAIAAGMAAASKIRRESPGASITVFEKSSEVSYAACGLPYYIGGLIIDKNLLQARNKEQFIEMGIDIKTLHEVIKLNPELKNITIKDIESDRIFSESYDKLLIATGASPIKLKITENISNVYTLKNIHDADKIKKALNYAKKVALVGAGYIGIEMADVLQNLKMETIIIESSNRILSNFDHEITEVLEKHIEKKGVTIKRNSNVTNVYNIDDNKIMLEINGKDHIEADFAIFNIGFKPETLFLKGSGISLAPNGAIMVNRYMETNIPDIFASGDCATIYHKITRGNTYIALGTYANKTGRVAASNIIGKKEKFYGAIGTSMIKVIDMEVATTGLNEKQVKDMGINYDTVFIKSITHPHYYPGAEPLYIKLIYSDDNIVLGGQIVGGKGAALKINTLAVCVDKQVTLEELNKMDFGYSPPFATVWDPLAIAASNGLKNNKH